MESGEEYALHRVVVAQGAFIGRVCTEYEATLAEIAAACFEDAVFVSPLAKALLEYAERQYASHLEFLWPNLPDAAILRRRESGKWFAVFMVIFRRKRGLPSDALVGRQFARHARGGGPAGG